MECACRACAGRNFQLRCWLGYSNFDLVQGQHNAMQRWPLAEDLFKRVQNSVTGNKDLRRKFSLAGDCCRYFKKSNIDTVGELTACAVQRSGSVKFLPGRKPCKSGLLYKKQVTRSLPVLSIYGPVGATGSKQQDTRAWQPLLPPQTPWVFQQLHCNLVTTEVATS